MVGGDIKVVLTLDDKDFSVKTVKAGVTMAEFKRQAESVSDATKKMEGSLSTAAAKFRDVVFAVSILRYALSDFRDIVLAIPTAFIKSAGEMERMTTLLEGLSKEADEAKKKAEALAGVRFVFGMASNAPFELKTLTNTFVKLKTAGIDPTNGSMKALVDSVAKFGGTDEQLNRAAVAIQQMAGKGVISMEELRQQLGEAVPNAIQLMARGMGMSMAELVKAISSGSVAAQGALAKMFIQMEIDAAGSAQRMMKTIPGMINQLKTEWEKFKITAAGMGASDIFKEEITRLINFMRSEDGRRLAEGIGKALRDTMRFIVEVKDAIIELLPVIKALGYLYGVYLASQLGKGIWSRAVEGMNQMKLKMAEMTAARQAHILVEEEALRRQLNNATTAQATIESTIKKELQAFDKKQIAAIKTAEAELEQVKKLSAAKLAEADKTTQLAGKMYAEAIRYEQKINEIDASGKARQGRKRDNYLFNMEAYRQETIALNERAVKMRQDAAQSVEVAEQKVAALNSVTEAERRAAFANSETGRTLMATNAAQTTYIQNIRAQIAEKQRLAAAASSAGAAIVGFGKSLLVSLGWAAAFSLAIMGIVAAYDKLTGAARRAAEAERARADLAKGIASEESLKQQMAALKDQQEAYDRAVAQASSGNGKISDVAQKKLDMMKAKLDDAKNQVRQTREIVDRMTATNTASNFMENLRAEVESKSLQINEFQNLEAARELFNEAQETKNQKAIAETRAMEFVATKQWAEAKIRAAKEAYAKLLPSVQKQGGDALAKFNASYQEYLTQLQAQAKTVDAPNDLIGGASDLAARRAAAKESPLLKAMLGRDADLQKARAKLASLTAETRSIADDAKYNEAVELLMKLARGEFDIAPTKDTPGMEPGKDIREGLMGKLAEFMREGKGSVEDFIKTLTFLDVKAKKGEQSMMSMFLAMIKSAGETATTSALTKGLAEVNEDTARSTIDLALAQEELRNNTDALPTSVAALERKYAALAQTLGLTGDELKKFQERAAVPIANQLRVDNARDLAKLERDINAEKIRGIVNVRERETAEHELRIAQINREEKAELARANNQADLEQSIRQKAIKARELEMIRYRNANKSQLDRLVDDWLDVNSKIDASVTNLMKGAMDKLMEFVDTGKLRLGDLLQSFLKDLARTQLQRVFAPMVQQAGDALTGLLTGIFGGDASSSTGQPKYDTGTGAMLVKNVDGSASAIANSAFSTSQNNVWTSVKNGFERVTNFIKNDFMSMIGDVGKGFWKVISDMGSGLYDMFSGMGGGGSDWLDWIGDAFISIFGFAKGGVMTPMGPLPLRAYAGGGIADRPQVAVFGEGSMNEAFVPLPDGRSIPVTMTGQSGGAKANVTINVINQAGKDVEAKQQGAPRFDGKQMVLDIVLTAAGQPGPFRDGMRSVMGGR